ncbi:sigma-70 family RNA polymerase sigma factor [Candidatus Uhrbacteria bacterium]|nr:sigma-70 family RNA polymerase sigma factor [Candidatus Uhrbacteria bacterium]MBD3284304.1 sigma-70 family RNA polymerase sigma factor [Candidatus Uhrbacteria bacterium]
MVHSPDLQTKTDEELAELSLKQQEVFGVLIQRYQERLLRYILRISGTKKEDAEDILQDTFIKVYQNLNGFDPKQKFSSWIYRITRNEVISNYRKLQARAEGRTDYVEESAFYALASDLDITRDIEMKDLRQTICKVLEEMDPKYREVLVLKYLEEKDYKEISYILKKPMGTVATLLNRAKKRFTQQATTMGIELKYV